MSIVKKIKQIEIINKFCERKAPIPRNQVVESKKKYNRKKYNINKEEY